MDDHRRSNPIVKINASICQKSLGGISRLHPDQTIVGQAFGQKPAILKNLIK
jgi:hypothetical protein